MAEAKDAIFSVNVEGLPETYTSFHPHIVHGRMFFDGTTMKGLYGETINRLLGYIEKQRNEVLDKGIVVDRLILSGGLGQSVYVRECIEKEFGKTEGDRKDVRKMTVCVAPDPQLAVCCGIVTARLSEYSHDSGIISHKCCSESYGLVSTKSFEPSLDVRHTDTESIYWVIHKVRLSICSG